MPIGNESSSGRERNINDAAQSVILLCLLPFLNISSFAYLYTALPLHIVDQGWPLWHLSILMSVCFVPRLVLSAIAVRVGEWLAVCTTCIGAALSILIVVAPNNLTAVYAGVFGTCLAVMAPTYRSLVYKRFGSDGDWQQQRALRWFTLFDTIGYSCGPFVGGSLYDIGGFQACGIFQTVAQFACTLLPLALPDVQRSFRGCCTWRHLQPVATTTALESAAVPSTTASVTAVPAVPIPASPTPAATAPLSSATALAPAIALLFAAFTNICVYGVEWALYALYFRSVYSWSGAATGAAQMAGDLLGGITLALSTLGCVSRAASRWQQVIPACLHAWFRPPLNVALLLGCHGALLALLAQPQFAVACTGQVLLGTVYVFCEQAVQEMLVTYSFGHQATYQRLVSAHYLFFCAGACACAPIAIGMYEFMGFTSTFYTTAVASGAFSVAFGAFFIVRLYATTEGAFGSLAKAEAELRGVVASSTNNDVHVGAASEREGKPLPDSDI